MPGIGGRPRGLRNDDYVECACCGHKLCRRNMENHFLVHTKGGAGYPPHPRTANTKLYNELTDPTDKKSKAIKTKSFYDMWNISQSINDIENEEIILDPHYVHKTRNRKPPKVQTNGSVVDLFNKINQNILSEQRLSDDQKYFNEKIKLIMQQIKESTINIDHLMDDESADYQSLFETFSDINQCLLSSKEFINNISNIFDLKTLSVYTLSDLILKYYYNGSRITKHPECAKGFALKYCVSCCDVPVYPNDGTGDIVHGRVVSLDIHVTNHSEWYSMRRADHQHFIKDDKHWANLCGGRRKVKDKAYEAQRNQFRLMLRMLMSNVAMVQWPKWLYLQNESNVNVGNIGHSAGHLQKLVIYTADKILRNIGDDLQKPSAATKRPKPFSMSWDKVTTAKKKLEPGLMKVRMNGMFAIQTINVSLLDYKSDRKKGNGKSLARNKCHLLLQDMRLTKPQCKMYFSGQSYDRQYFHDHVHEYVEDELDLAENHQSVNDACHQWELAQDVRKTNSAYDCTQLQLNRSVLQPLQHGSNEYIALKNKMGRAWKGLTAFCEPKYHIHKTKAIDSIDNSSIVLNKLYSDKMAAKPPRDINNPSKEYKKWKKQSDTLSSMQWNMLNKFDLDFNVFIDSKTTNYQSPNQPWQQFKVDTIAMKDTYTFHLGLWLNYKDKLIEMNLSDFISKKHLFPAEILALYPHLKAFTIENGKIYKCGNLDRIKSKYSRKKYDDDDQKLRFEKERDELLEINKRSEMNLICFKRKNNEYCYICNEQNWNGGQIECDSCKIMVHIECDDPEDPHDAKWYKQQNEYYECQRCAGNDVINNTIFTELFNDEYDEDNLEKIECADPLRAMIFIVEIICKDIELLISGLHYKMMYPSLIDEIHQLLDYNAWFDCLSDIKLLFNKLKHNEVLVEFIQLNENNEIKWEYTDLWDIADIDIYNDFDIYNNVQLCDIMRLLFLLNQYKMFGHESIDCLIAIYDADEDLKKMKFTTKAVKEQQDTIKVRLFIIYCNGQFHKVDELLSNLSKKTMKYKWTEYNTFIWCMFEKEEMYTGNHDYLFVAEYHLSQGCPESMVESACSILEIILRFKWCLSIKIINSIFLIRYYLGQNEFGKGWDFVDELTTEYLSCNRAPITGHRSLWPQGKILTKMKAETNTTIHSMLKDNEIFDLGISRNDAFSDYGSEDEDDEVLHNFDYMDPGDVTLGF